MTGVPTRSFPTNNDASEGPINVAGGGFPYLRNRNATQIYVSEVYLLLVLDGGRL